MTDSITPEGSSEGAEEGFGDSVEADALSKETVTNDAVAGETVLPEAEGDRSGRDYGTGDGDEFTLPASESDTAEPDMETYPPGETSSDASGTAGVKEPLDLRDRG
jgi:hypothetical protein